MKPVSILASGMVTGAGLSSAATCAAIRCAMANFTETRFMDQGGEWIIGSHVSLGQPWRGIPKLVRMSVSAIGECLAEAHNANPSEIPLLLCVAERERPGRVEDLEERLPLEIGAALGVKFHPHSSVIPHGRVAGALALEQAARMIHEEGVPYCIIAGADSFLVAATMSAYDERSRLLTSVNPNGFIPGEASAAILVAAPGRSGAGELCCLGMGRGHERATLESGEPLRADGLVNAFRAAFADAGCGFEQVDYRATDANGEHYWFKEAALALTRCMRVRKEQFFLLHVADCIGETGAAVVPATLGFILIASQKAYVPGAGALCHFGDDLGERIALVLRRVERRVA